MCEAFTFGVDETKYPTLFGINKSHRKDYFYCKAIDMKGVSFATNDKNEKIAVQLDLKMLGKHQEEIQDILDVIIAESRENDEDVSWTSAKKKHKKSSSI